MQFGSFMKTEADDRGPDALAVEQPFDQAQILRENVSFIQKSLDLDEIQILSVHDEGIPGDKKKIENAAPGKPAFQFY